MKLCSDCTQSRWPFLMVFVIATVIGFVTWLILGLSIPDQLLRLGAAVTAFAATGLTLLHYVLTCLRRHCRHEHHHHPRSV